MVDVKKVPELGRLDVDDSELLIGAAVTCAQVYEQAGICEEYAALADAARIIGGIQIQNRASLGGNLCNSSPAADSIPPMIVLQGVCDLQGPAGRRSVPVAKFCTGPGTNVLRTEAADGPELLVQIRFPRPGPRSGSCYQRFIPRNEMDIAVVGVAAWVQLDETGATIDDVRLALGAVAPTPLPVDGCETKLRGLDPDRAIPVAADLARAAASPIDDMRGTKEFRRHVVGVLVERVLTEAVRRARAALPA